MPYFVDFFIISPDYSFKKYLIFLRSKGQKIASDGYKELGHWYKTDLKHAKKLDYLNNEQKNKISVAYDNFKDEDNGNTKAMVEDVEASEATYNYYVYCSLSHCNVFTGTIYDPNLSANSPISKSFSPTHNHHHHHQQKQSQQQPQEKHQGQQQPQEVHQNSIDDEEEEEEEHSLVEEGGTQDKMSIENWRMKYPGGEVESLVVDNNNISHAFCQYKDQAQFQFINDTGPFCIESYLNEFMALSGILLLQKDHEHDELLKKYIPNGLYKSLYRISRDTYYDFNFKFSQERYFKIKELIEGYLEDHLDQNELVISLLSKCKISTVYEAKAIRAIAYLVPELQNVNGKQISENYLSASYIHVFIRCLFGDEFNISHCSDLEAADKKRPDYEVDHYYSYEYEYTAVFG